MRTPSAFRLVQPHIPIFSGGRYRARPQIVFAGEPCFGGVERGDIAECMRLNLERGIARRVNGAKRKFFQRRPRDG